MAKKKQTMEWGGFLNVRLSDEQKARFEVWRKEMADDIWELFLQALMQGMKISITYDPETDTYTASMTNSPRCTCGVSSMYVLSAYAQQWHTAISLVLFKHYQLLGGTWENYRPSRPTLDRLG